MDLKAKTSFSSSIAGNVESGQILYGVDSAFAVHLVENGLCEFHGSAGKQAAPLTSGPAQPSLSSQAGQASQSNSVNTSASDSSKAPAESSQSTPVSDASQAATPSTDSTAHSGASTTKKRRSRAKK